MEKYYYMSLGYMYVDFIVYFGYNVKVGKKVYFRIKNIILFFIFLLVYLK